MLSFKISDFLFNAFAKLFETLSGSITVDTTVSFLSTIFIFSAKILYTFRQMHQTNFVKQDKNLLS